MKKGKGWRAIIYDAPWAFFKKNQPGVIVSEDGKSCETVDDDKSNIIIIAYKNTEQVKRTRGHVFFRQKGTELFDIVCLDQNASVVIHQLELIVDDVTIDGCSTQKYLDLKEAIKNRVYWVEDSVRTPCTDFVLKTPTQATILDGGETYPIKVTAKIYDKEYDASANVYVTNADEESEPVRVETIFSIDCIKNYITKKTGGSVTCSIYPNNKEVECKGNVTFKLNKNDTTYVTYEIGLACAGVINKFQTTKCNAIEREFSEQGNLLWTVDTDNGNVNVINQGPPLQISVKNGVSKVKLIATETTYNISQPITINLPN
jgi:hypothetical protein